MKNKLTFINGTLIFILFVHALLLGYSGLVHSPTFDEWGHLPSGIIHWTQSRFDPYRVNPPAIGSYGGHITGSVHNRH